MWGKRPLGVTENYGVGSSILSLGTTSKTLKYKIKLAPSEGPFSWQKHTKKRQMWASCGQKADVWAKPVNRPDGSRRILTDIDGGQLRPAKATNWPRLSCGLRGTPLCWPQC